MKIFIVFTLLLALTVAAQAQTVTVVPGTSYQTMTGWEGTSQTGYDHNYNTVSSQYPSDTFLAYRDDLWAKMADAGVNRIRIEAPFDMEAPNDTFNWTRLDRQMDAVYIPYRDYVLSATGEHVLLNICVVDFVDPAFQQEDNPADYADFVFKVIDRIWINYGIRPDYIEGILEPDRGGNFGDWTATTVANNMVAANNSLVAGGHTGMKWIAPSISRSRNALTWYNNAKAANANWVGLLSEASFHIYDDPPVPPDAAFDTIYANYYNAANADGVRTSMLEFIAATYIQMHQMLEHGKISSFQQFALAFRYNVGDTADNGERYFLPVGATVNVGSRTKYLRQYFKFIRYGAVMKGVTNSSSTHKGLPFQNTNGTYVVPIKSTASGTITVKDLPAGTYKIKYTTAAAYDINLTPQTITTGQDVVYSMPAAGVSTVYDENYLTAPPPPAVDDEYETLTKSHSPVAYYGMDEASGAAMADGSGNSRPATLAGPYVRAEPELLRNQTTAGVSTKMVSGTTATTNTAWFTTTNAASVSMMWKWNNSAGTAQTILKVGTFGSATLGYHELHYNGSSKSFKWYYNKSNGTGFNFESSGDNSFTPTLGRDYHVAVTHNYSTGVVSFYIDGELLKSVTAATGANALTNRTITFFETLDSTIDDLALFTVALTSTQVKAQFAASRVADPDASAYYVAPTGSVHGKGTITDPITIETGVNFGLLSAGKTLFFMDGTYTLTAKLLFKKSGTVGNPITYRHVEDSLAVIEAKDFNRLEIDPGSSYLKFIFQTYASPGKVAGLVVTNPDTRRVAWINGSDPETASLDNGTLTNDGFVTSDPNVIFRSGSTVGSTFNLYDSTTLMFTSTVTAVNGLGDITLADSYGGTQALGGTWTVKMVGTTGGRDDGDGMVNYGPNNEFINPIFHDVATGFSDWVQATGSVWYGGVIYNNGWVASDRGHGHAFYAQNDNTTQSSLKSFTNAIYANNFSTNGKLYGVTGYADNLNYQYNVSYSAGYPNMIMFHDIKPTKTGTGSITSGQTTLNFTNTIGSLAQNDYIRVKGAGRAGNDLYTRVDSVAGPNATLRHAAQTTVSGNAWSVHNGGMDDNILIGSGDNSKPSNDIVASNNRMWTPADGRQQNGMVIGYTALTNVNADINNNYLVATAPLSINRFETVNASGNTIVGRYSSSQYSAIQLNSISTEDGLAPDTEVWTINNNTYHSENHPTTAGLTFAFRSSGTLNRTGTLDLPFLDTPNPTKDWQGGAGHDPAGSFTATLPSTNVVFVDVHDTAKTIAPRAHISIFNWQGSANVTVNLSTVGLAEGQAYQVRSAEDYFGTPVASGTYTAGTQTVSIPMTTSINVAQPVGWTENGLGNLTSTRPDFGAFVLLAFPVDAPPLPYPPDNITVGRLSTTSVNVSWQLNPAVAFDDVVLEYSVDQISWTPITLASNDETEDVTGLTPLLTYYFRVKTVNATGPSPYSDTVEKALTRVNYYGATEPVVQ